MGEKYYTVSEKASISFKIQKSKFIGHISPTQNKKEAENFIEKIEKKHEDATHNVPAYRLRNSPTLEWSSDNGEPSGSAGKPALNILKKEKLENITTVVTRYYGGKELGYGGLVRAYSRSVKKAIKKAEKKEVLPYRKVNLEVDYDNLGDVKRVLNKNELEFNADYKETVNIKVKIPEDSIEKIRDSLMSATSGRIEIEGDP